MHFRCYRNGLTKFGLQKQKKTNRNVVKMLIKMYIKIFQKGMEKVKTFKAEYQSEIDTA